MKKVIYILSILCFQFSQGQNKNIPFFNDLYLGVNISGNYISSDVVGLSNYFEDYKFEKNSKDEVDIGFGINLSKQVLPYFNLGIEYSRGNLSGTELDNVNENFTRHVRLTYNSFQVNSKFYLNRMFRKRLMATEVNVFLSGGIGFNNSSGTIYRVKENGSLNEEFDYQSQEGLLTSLGLGFDMKVTRRTDFEIGFVKYFTGINSLDGIDYRLGANTRNDQYYKLYLGLNFLLGNKKSPSKRWDKTYGKVKYGKNKYASNKIVEKPSPTVTKIEKRGTKTIMYADGKVEKIVPENEVVKVVTYSISQKKDSTINEESFLVDNNKIKLKAKQTVKKDLDLVAFENKSISSVNNETKGSVSLRKNGNTPVVSKVKETIDEVKIVENKLTAITENEMDLGQIQLRKSQVKPELLHIKSDAEEIVINQAQLKINTGNENDFQPQLKKDFDKNELEVEIVDESIIIDNPIVIDNTNESFALANQASNSKNLRLEATEISNIEARKIQSNYVASIDNDDDQSFLIQESLNIGSRNSRYVHKVVQNSNRKIHTVTGNSLSKKEEMSIANEDGTSLIKNAVPKILKTKISGQKEDKKSIGKSKVLFYETGLGFITDPNIIIIDDLTKEMQSNDNLVMILEKEETDSKAINKKNTKRILKLVTFLKNKKSMDTSKIRIINTKSNSEKGQKRIVIFTEEN